MRVIHLLRKHDPAEWGGTETAVNRLFAGLRAHGVLSVMYCPYVSGNGSPAYKPGSPTANAPGPARSDQGDIGHIKRFRSFIPAWGISPEERRQLISVGGNLMSFDLLPALWREPDVALIHTHTLGRLGGIASAVARGRRLPFVVSIHGGLLDVSPAVKTAFNASAHRGFEWGKIFGLLLQSRRLIQHADAVLTCNPTEAELLRKHHPGKRIEIQPHGIPLQTYLQDHRAAARQAYPQICGRDLFLCVGRIDPAKNQAWLIAQVPELFRNHPNTVLALAGASTHEDYGQALERQIHELGIGDRVLLTGGLPPDDPRLIGLMQESRAVLLPSISETFGLVLVEAWAAGTTVICSRTSGASALVRNGENGWLFDLSEPGAFHQAIRQVLLDPGRRQRLVESGRELVLGRYDMGSVAGQVKQLYTELIGANHALRHSA